MSFSYEIKSELCKLMLNNDAKNKQVCLYGMLLFLRRFSIDNISFTTEHEETVNLLFNLITEIVSPNISVSITSTSKKDNTPTYTFSVDDKASVIRIIRYFQKETGTNLDTLDCDYLRRDDEAMGAFVRGIYLIGGSIIDPNKEYHLEIFCPSESLAKELLEIMKALGFKIRLTNRKGNFVLYIKESEQIEDFLTFIGAVNASIEIMNVKVYKNIINKVNRITNCELANINRTLSAAQRQAEDIEYVLENKSLVDISDELLELAQLRLENSDTSLKDLGQMLKRPISKSGVNHRLIKLSKLAEEIRDKKKREAQDHE